MTCRRAAELISENLDADLRFTHRAGLGFHTLLCTACRRYLKQIEVLDEMARDLISATNPGYPDSALSPDIKDQLKAMIEERIDG